MPRLGPRIPVEDIIARAVLEPSGAHKLEVSVPSEVFGMTFHQGHVPMLKSIIAQFEAVTMQADGGPNFYNRRIVPIEVKP
ncbi:hypothetical protein [Devosia sp. 1635]|uniref:hypothetical protein n=1 Tax=Devosia sp. 1635 TaxID=2726066 RepID=UPI00156532F7|nr:hypothetical protein [Devosia sp. 1635]